MGGRMRRRTVRMGEGEEMGDDDRDHIDGLDMQDDTELDPSFLLKLDRRLLSRSRGESLRDFAEEKRRTKREGGGGGRQQVVVETTHGMDSGADTDSAISASSRSPTPSIDIDDSDEEQAYERRPRSMPGSKTAEDKVDARLPTKTKEGRKIFPRPFKERPGQSEERDGESDGEEGEHDSEDSGQDDHGDGDSQGRRQSPTPVSFPDEIARISQLVQEDPEENIMQMNRIISLTHPSREESCKILAMVSLLALFIDIIPGYRIAHLTEKQKQESVSREIKRIRHFEQSLLDIYAKYIRRLELAIKAGPDECALVAEQCMCALLEKKYYFNYRLNVIHAVVAAACKRTWSARVERCAQAIRTLFAGDREGSASFECVRVMTKVVKDRNYLVHPKALGVLLALQIHSGDVKIRADESGATFASRERQGKGKRGAGHGAAAHLSRKAKKRKEEESKVEAEMKQAEAVLDREAFEKEHREILKMIFVLFFRILKSQLVKPNALLPIALDGLAKFAHLINIDFFKDILATLRRIIANAVESEEEASGAGSTSRSSRIILSTISTAFKLASGQGEALVIDLDDFTGHLYRLLIPLSLDPAVGEAYGGEDQVSMRTGLPVSSLAHLLVDSLDRALLRLYPPPPLDRSAAFVRRLLITTFYFPPKTAKGILIVVRNVLAKASKLDALFEHDPADGYLAGAGAAGGLAGRYDGESESVQHAAAWGSTSFESLALAYGTQPGYDRLGPRGHVSPGVRAQTEVVCQWRHPSRRA